MHYTSLATNCSSNMKFKDTHIYGSNNTSISLEISLTKRSGHGLVYNNWVQKPPSLQGINTNWQK